MSLGHFEAPRNPLRAHLPRVPAIGQKRLWASIGVHSLAAQSIAAHTSRLAATLPLLANFEVPVHLSALVSPAGLAIGGKRLAQHELARRVARAVQHVPGPGQITSLGCELANRHKEVRYFPLPAR